MENKEKVKINWADTFKTAAILFLIAAIAALLLALTNYITSPVIAKQTEETNTAARQAVLPDADSFEVVEDLDAIIQEALGEDALIVEEAYVGLKDDQIVGYAIKTTPSGYGGDIELLTGIGIDGKTTGIAILSQDETPGLGARSTETAFQDQYKGLDASEEISVVKNQEASGNQIVAITGATITSKAVTSGVNVANEVFQALQAEGE